MAATFEAVECVRSRLAEKQRLVPEVEPCSGHGPRCWPRGAVGLEAEQLQDGGHADGGANGGEVDGGLSGGGWLAAFVGAGPGVAACGVRGPRRVCGRGWHGSPCRSFELVLGRDVADGAVQANGVVMADVIGDEARASSKERGTLTRMQSPLRVLCQRSILPFAEVVACT